MNAHPSENGWRLWLIFLTAPGIIIGPFAFLMYAVSHDIRFIYLGLPWFIAGMIVAKTIK